MENNELKCPDCNEDLQKDSTECPTCNKPVGKTASDETKKEASTTDLPENFVYIQGGTFTMGSPVNEVGRNSEEIQREVTVSSFQMCKFQVTQQEFEEIMGHNPSKFKGKNLPAENVTWDEAIEYCIKRSQNEDLTPVYTYTKKGDVEWNRNANGYRLPTEAEWEYACRADTTTAYNTGDSISDDTGWYKDNSNGVTHPVGQKPANAWGLFDMHGNVWEWCYDRYEKYSKDATTDPLGTSGHFRVHRGGSYRNSARRARSAHRDSYGPSTRWNSYGFRLVRT